MNREAINSNNSDSCEEPRALTPIPIENRPGLCAISYRTGTHGSFKKSMLHSLSKQPALRQLQTRSNDDSSIALLDAWAMVLDVLAFYQERIANEGFLRTATERISVLELARSIGYELRPGVAASVYLAFSVEESAFQPGAAAAPPLRPKIEAGTKVQSIPGQDETAQIFQTIDEIEARSEWNALKPKMTEFVMPGPGDTRIYLKGTATNLKQGDMLLYAGSQLNIRDFIKVRSAEEVYPSEPTADPDAGYTIVTLDRGMKTDLPTENPKFYAMRLKANLFAHNAPDWRSMSDEIKVAYNSSTDKDGNPTDTEWPRFNIAYQKPIPGTVDRIYLDSIYPQILPDSDSQEERSFLMLSTPDYHELLTVENVTEESRTDFTITTKTTCVWLNEDLDAKTNQIEKWKLRETVVFAKSEYLKMAEHPVTEDVRINSNSVPLSGKVEGLVSGRLLVITGTDTETGEPASEVVRLVETIEENEAASDGSGDTGVYTKLIFTPPLQHSYRRESLSINANVARATHGETKTEVLGSGDASRKHQKFMLKNVPLTYVSVPTVEGIKSTLEVRVNGILWEEVPDFYQIPPEKRAYITRMADDGRVTVQFGDGINGMRLPSGTDNVMATYRVGTGLHGMLKAGQLSLLMTRPLGVKGVINPIASTGAEDPEKLDQARQNAPFTITTLDRIVSLQDFEDFTRVFPGIGKAQATLIWNGERQQVHLTIAGADGSVVEKTSSLYQNLAAGIDSARHPDNPVYIDSYISKTFNLSATIFIDKAHLAEVVLAAISKSLKETFSFEKRSFGQVVRASEVMEVIQAIKGVIGVDLDELGGANPFEQPLLSAYPARWDQENKCPKSGELLTIDPNRINLTEVYV